MKRLLILFYIVAFAQMAQAQATQGSVVATGSFNYFTSLGKGKEGNTKNTHRFNISPQIGYLVADNLEIGLFAYFDVYEHQSETLTITDERYLEKNKTKNKAIGSYLRKYILLAEKLALAGKAEIYYSTYTDTSNSYKNKDGRNYNLDSFLIENSQFEVAVRPGLSYFISDNISLNTTYGALSYAIDSSDYEAKQESYQSETEFVRSKNESTKLSLDLSTYSFTLGLSYFF